MTEAAYEVHLEMFEGPLDLLLFLIKKDDLDIYDIPISQITREYLEYLDVMRELNLEVAGEFLVLASTLMQVKSRMLLPAPPEEGEPEGPDPRAELVARLVEYQKFKEAARFLESRRERFKDIFYRGMPRFSDEEKVLELSLFDLLSVLKEALERAETSTTEVLGEEFPIEEKMQKILFLLQGRPSVLFVDLLAEETKRRGMVTCLFALLELIRLGRVFARQDAPFGPIRIYRSQTSQAEA